jgi:hypothetical protein
MFRTSLSLLAALAVTSGAWAGGQPEPKLTPEAEKAKGVLDEHVKKIKAEGGSVVWISEEALTKTFPKHQFFALRFRIYPVAKQLPEGMKPSNLFVVLGDKVEHLKDAKALEAFFKANAPAVSTKDQALAALHSWLALGQEFVQDGFYKFKLEKVIDHTNNDLAPGKIQSTATVMAGGNGEITATLELDKAGKVVAAAQEEKIKQGPRPICQATKLLDADPIVRKMAEADLLYMGLAARDYLMEQREQASPELRRAIDQLWQRIQKEGW